MSGAFGDQNPDPSTWPVQEADGYHWLFYDSYNHRWAVVEDALATPQIWTDIHSGAKCLLERKQTMFLDWTDSFEEEFYRAPDPHEDIEECDQLLIPPNWFVDWVQTMDDNVRPEWKHRRLPDETEVKDGQQSAGVHTSSAKHHTVLWRHLPAIVGTKYQLRVWVFGDSDRKSGHAIAAGLDPYGGTDWARGDAQWGWYGWDSKPSIWQNRQWFHLYTPIMEAQSTRITVYLRSWARYAADAAAIFDQVELWADYPAPPPIEPPTPPEIDYEYIIDEVIERLMGFHWVLRKEG